MKQLLLLLLLGSSLSMMAQSPTKAELQEMYQDFLTEKGIPSEIDSDGDVKFRQNNKTYFIIIDMKDLAFFRLVLPNIWDIENLTEHQQALQACNNANQKTKVGKAYIVKDNVWIASELLLDQPADFAPLFDRAMRELSNCVDYFVGSM